MSPRGPRSPTRPLALVAHALLPRYAAGTLPRPLARFVRDALDADPALAAAYTALRRAERAAAHGAHTSAGQRDLLEAALFANAPTPSLRPTTRRAPALFAPLAACASLAVFAMVSGSQTQPVSTHAVGTHAVGDLAARSAAVAADPLGVKVTCVHDERVVDTATAGARRPSDALTCPPDAMLAFSLTNLGPHERHVFVVGLTPSGATRWYAPFDRTSTSVRAHAGRDNHVLPVLGDMRGMPADEHVTLHVLLSDQPFAARDVERQLDAARARGVPVGNIEKLPLPDIPLQARVDMLRTRAGEARPP
jgi:hypothetical protein